MTTKKTEHDLAQARRELAEAKARSEKARRQLATAQIARALRDAGGHSDTAHDAASIVLLHASDLKLDDEGELDVVIWNGKRYFDGASLAKAFLERAPHFAAEPARGSDVEAAGGDSAAGDRSAAGEHGDWKDLSPQEIANLAFSRPPTGS